MNELQDQFTNHPDEEAERIHPAVMDTDLLQKLRDRRALTNQDYDTIYVFMERMSDIFNPDLPQIGGSVQEELLKSSQEINIGRFLREKSLVRIVQLLMARTKEGEPMWTTVRNSDTGEQFQTQEEFLGWYCEKASVSRSLTFRRVMLYKRLLALGFSLEEAYDRVKVMPYAMDEGVKMLVMWDKDTVEGISLNVADSLQKEYYNLYTAEENMDIEDLIDSIRKNEHPDPEDRKILSDLLRPAIREAITDAAYHSERPQDAIKKFKHDISGKPEIVYLYRSDIDSIVIKLIKTSIDEHGNEYAELDTIVEFLPQTSEVPAEIIADLVNRLPFTNKKDIS